MNIDSLKNFYEVATLKSISKVANNCHISQSALSQQLAKLEETLGIVALKRSNKGVELTAEGKILFNHAVGILKLYDNLLVELDNLHLDKDVLAIVSTCSSGSFLVSRALSKLSNKSNNLLYDIIIGCPNNIEHNVENNIFNLGISTTKIANSTLSTHHLGDDELIFVCRSSCSIEIDNLPFLLLKDELNIEKYIDNYINSNDIVLKTDSINSIVTYLLTTPSVSLLPKVCIKDYLDSGLLREIKIPDFNCTYSLFLTHKINIECQYKAIIALILDTTKNLLIK